MKVIICYKLVEFMRYFNVKFFRISGVKNHSFESSLEHFTKTNSM